MELRVGIENIKNKIVDKKYVLEGEIMKWLIQILNIKRIII